MEILIKKVIIVIIIIALIVLGINLYVCISTNKQIIKENENIELSNIDCIIICFCDNICKNQIISYGWDKKWVY